MTRDRRLLSALVLAALFFGSASGVVHAMDHVEEACSTCVLAHKAVEPAETFAPLPLHILTPALAGPSDPAYAIPHLRTANPRGPPV